MLRLGLDLLTRVNASPDVEVTHLPRSVVVTESDIRKLCHDLHNNWVDFPPVTGPPSHLYYQNLFILHLHYVKPGIRWKSE